MERPAPPLSRALVWVSVSPMLNIQAYNALSNRCDAMIYVDFRCAVAQVDTALALDFGVRVVVVNPLHVRKSKTYARYTPTMGSVLTSCGYVMVPTGDGFT